MHESGPAEEHERSGTQSVGALYLAGRDAAIAAGEIVQAGHEGHPAHEIQERVKRGEIKPARGKKDNGDQRRELNQVWCPSPAQSAKYRPGYG
jgi:hypothetical protein